MSHGTTAPAAGRATGNAHPSPSAPPASGGLPLPGGVPDGRGHPGSAPPAVRVLTGPLALLAANLLPAWPGQRAARLPSAQILRAE
jgi:hypothetical protein